MGAQFCAFQYKNGLLRSRFMKLTPRPGIITYYNPSLSMSQDMDCLADWNKAMINMDLRCRKL